MLVRFAAVVAKFPPFIAAVAERIGVGLQTQLRGFKSLQQLQDFFWLSDA